ncbi:hypothetical protein HPP92_024018 [Vanilla planifolia]|uniref:Plastid division protein PDV1 n=1 Tax=Vanilla planifolia TaxID=51239 RepID=A0A835PM45_VANPL|nr:hypothetical protein HPP92_024018 [Vanilla planifolia]
MRWEMEMEDIEVILERIWDLHDKISDAIHAISRAQFLKSIRNLGRESPQKKNPPQEETVEGGEDDRFGFVFVKGFRADEECVLGEARSLNAIRSALESLEEQLEFFHTIQSQQQAERDAAIARLEQSRIVLAMRLAEHQGRKHKVVEEAQAFVSDVQDAHHFVSSKSPFEVPRTQASEVQDFQNETRASTLWQMLATSFTLAKHSLSLDKLGGVLGNAAIFAVSVLAFLQMHRATHKQSQDANFYRGRGENGSSRIDGLSYQACALEQFDVLSARG